jgi:ribonucleotide monophosphatase NagD (HAD superfamily)
MVCYIVPSAAAIIHSYMRRRIPNWKNNIYQKGLTLLLSGGAIFGIVDHAWNGELLMVGENIVSDIMLGITITLTILVSWGIMVALDKSSVKEPARTL